MATQFEELALRVAALEQRLAGVIRYGRAFSVDPAAGTLRLKLSKAGEGDPVLTKRLPYAQTAGEMKFHNPPSIGQQMILLSPGGDMRSGVAIPLGWSDENVAPGNLQDDHVLTYGQARFSMKPDEWVITLGGSRIRIDPGNIKIDAGRIDLNGG